MNGFGGKVSPLRFLPPPVPPYSGCPLRFPSGTSGTPSGPPLRYPPSLKFERYRASIQRRLTQAHKQLNELVAARQKETQTTKAEAAKPPRFGLDGKPYEVASICCVSSVTTPRRVITSITTPAKRSSCRTKIIGTRAPFR